MNESMLAIIITETRLKIAANTDNAAQSNKRIILETGVNIAGKTKLKLRN